MNALRGPETEPAQNKRSNHSRYIRLLLGFAAAILYLFVRAHTPISVQADAYHDDQHFMSMAQHIANGDWLGTYCQMTLIKGPGYPLFLAFNAWLGTPVSLAEACFQGFAIGIFFWVFARVSRMPNVALLGFVTTLWMPDPYLERVIRDSIYPGQMLLLLSGLTASLYFDMPKKRRYTCALATGLILGWFCLTREEGVWIAPGITAIALAAAVHYRYKQQVISLVLIPLIIVTAGYGATQLAFLSANRINYGSFVGVEINSSPFKDAVAALQSVQAGKQIPFVPVSKQAREAIYQVSPSFLKLKAYFDPSTGGSPWQFGCKVYEQTCGEIAGGWFIWALRDAVAANGFYDSAEEAKAFYQGLTNEVLRACRTGQLQCKPSPFSMLPHISAAEWTNLPASLLRGIQKITFYTPSLTNIPSSGQPLDLMTDVEFLGRPVRTPSPNDIGTYSISGWYYGAGKTGWITGQITSGDGINEMHINRADSPDLVHGLNAPAAKHQRFNITVDCRAPCIFHFIDADGATLAINLARAAGHPSNHVLNGATLNIDELSRLASPINTDLRYYLASSTRKVAERTYGHFLPWLLSLSLPVTLAAVLLSYLTRSLTPTVALAVAFWALLISRLLLLALVDISSFPAMVVPYLSPAYLLTCITPILSLAALYELLKLWRSQKIPPSEITHI